MTGTTLATPRYFLDTEFIEDGKTIDLISIGIVCEDGREYYAQSTEFQARKASDWVRTNVFPHLVVCCASPERDHIKRRCDQPGCPWRTRAQIRDEILAFMDPQRYGPPELWGYYAAYDHVAFCQLFGTMMALPSGFPMYTHDIKHLGAMCGNPELPTQTSGNEHHALADARWNRDTYQLLMRYHRPSMTAEALARQITAIYVQAGKAMKEKGIKEGADIAEVLNNAFVQALLLCETQIPKKSKEA